jgi:acetyltransferase-like isoleucine patch superfamily enzyme
VNALREAVKRAGRATATLAVLPVICSFYVRRPLLGADRALMGSTQALGLVPGLLGQYLRRAFLERVLAACAPTAAIEFGTTFSDVRTRIGEHAYIGPNCHVGFADIGRDVLIAPCVHIPSGGTTHGSADLDVPLRNQVGDRRCVRIGFNSWIGSSAVVMADVGAQTIIGAGAVVTHAIPDRVIAAGVPARVIRGR